MKWLTLLLVIFVPALFVLSAYPEVPMATAKAVFAVR
jgi:hypothetical protein